jgi:hypothetical protein
MRASDSPNAFDPMSWTAFERLSWSAKAGVATVTAVAVGFLVGSAAIGPVLSDNSPDNAAAIQARFERRTVDPRGHYPDPLAYRAPTPDFGPHQGPALGAYARQQARRGRGAPAAGLPPEAAEAFGSVQRSPVQQRSYDRHTGVSY